MADAPDSKSGRGNPVWVQVPPPAPTFRRNNSKFAIPLFSIQHCSQRAAPLIHGVAEQLKLYIRQSIVTA